MFCNRGIRNISVVFSRRGIRNISFVFGSRGIRNISIVFGNRGIINISFVFGVDSLAQWLEHWIFNQEDRVRFPGKTEYFCSCALFLCCGLHVVRWGLVRDWTLYAENGFTSSYMMTSLKRGSVTTEHSYLRLSALANYA